MCKLLRADFGRLFKNKLFWAVILLVSGYSIYRAFGTYDVFVNRLNDGFEYTVMPFEFIIVLPIIIAIFTCFFIKVNESDGIIRNKLFCGHTRTAVYLSNICIMAFVSAVCSFIFSLSFIPLIILGKSNVPVLFAFFIVSALLNIAVGLIATFIAFNVKGTAVSVIAAVLAVALMFGASVKLHRALEESETYFEIDKVDGVEFTPGSAVAEGSEITYKEIPNPYYRGGTKREVYKFIHKTLPTSHFRKMSKVYITTEDNKLKTPGSLLESITIKRASDVFKEFNTLHPLGLGVIITALGIFIYKKKNIN